MKKLIIFTLTLLGVLGAASLAMAAVDVSVTNKALDVISSVALVSGLGIGLGVVGPGIGQGLTMLGALTGMARNPSASGTLRVNMLIGLALIESLAIYALVISLILLYAFPYSDLVEPLIQAASAS